MKRTVAVLGFALLSFIARAAHAGVPIQFFPDKPTDPKAKPVDKFKAGDPIWAVAQFKKPLAELNAGRGAIDISIQCGPNGWSGLHIPITDANKNETTLGFYLIGPGMDEKAAKTLVNWLGEQGTGPIKLAVGVNGGYEAVGRLTLDMSPGKAAYDKFVADATKTTLAANANVALPKAMRSDPKLESDVIAMLKTEAPHMKIHRVILTRPDWSIEREPRTQKILKRSQFVALLSENIKTNTCIIEPDLAIEQPSTGPNTWGKLTRGGATATEPTKVPCERFKSK